MASSNCGLSDPEEWALSDQVKGEDFHEYVAAFINGGLGSAGLRRAGISSADDYTIFYAF